MVSVAKNNKIHKLNNKSKILDVGCGKGYLLYEIKKFYQKSKLKDLIFQLMQ